MHTHLPQKHPNPATRSLNTDVELEEQQHMLKGTDE